MKMKLLLLALGAYLLIVVLVYLFQDQLVFPGSGRGKGVRLELPAGVQVETRRLHDGSEVRYAVADPTGGAQGLLLFFLGNFEDLRSGVTWAAAFARLGFAVVVPEYPTYGDSTGRVGVAPFLAAAEQAAEFAQQRAARLGVPFAVGGISLGSFSATHVATFGKASQLLLLAPLTSVAEVAQRQYWFLPVPWLLRHRFDNLGKVKAVRARALVVHGEHDTIVPPECGKRLAAALGARFELAPGHDHNDLFFVLGEPLGARIREHLLGR